MTKLLYLSDTYIFSGTATILEAGMNEYGEYIVLDQTIFYPQWGGQPSDIGTLSSENTLFEVNMVRLDENGIVYHYWSSLKGESIKWMNVTLKIDGERRIINARTHSAGHLIDVAMQHIWLSLTPTKWYHFPDGPYVEYSWTLREPIDSLIAKLQAELDRLIKLDIPMIITTDASVKSPIGKNPRYVQFEGHTECGCGGTHMRSSGEIRGITIRKIKMKDWNIRVSYSISVE